MKPESAAVIAMRERLSGESFPRRIKIDGEIYQIDEVHHWRGSPLADITSGNVEFILAKSSKAAGQAARERWQDMKDHDRSEFVSIIGEGRLIKWACSDDDEFGISSFDEFLDAIENVPEEEFASYDGKERTVNRCGKLANELGFMPTVAYRSD
ncbi:MAG TPA: hypothetical protein VIY48_02940 [Candidatus Paceibacterota bacterium]